MKSSEDNAPKDSARVLITEEKQLNQISTSNDEPPEQSEALKKIIEQESTNFQWGKLALNIGMLAIMIMSKLIRGPGGGEESIFGY